VPRERGYVTLLLRTPSKPVAHSPKTTNPMPESIVGVAEIVGAMAAMAGLFYVGFQIRQNTAAVRSTTAQAVHDSYALWYAGYAADPALMRIAVEGLKDYRSLGEIEKAQFIALFMQFISYSQNAFYQWREGTLSPELWVGWELLMMNLVSAPGGKDFWAERGYMCGPDFQLHVEQVIMTRSPDERAKPLGAFPINSPTAGS
jgi:hypothetical protein